MNCSWINKDYCIVLYCSKNRHAFEPVIFDGKELSVVSSAKILGVTLSSGLRWNDHVNEAIRKVNKRLYFLVLLKRARVSPHDIRILSTFIALLLDLFSNTVAFFPSCFARVSYQRYRASTEEGAKNHFT